MCSIAGVFMTLAGFNNLEAQYTDTRKHQQWLAERERQTERAVAGIDARGEIAQTYSDNSQAQYNSLILEGYICSDQMPPRFDIQGQSMVDEYVKVFDQNRLVIGTLHPLSQNPEGYFQFHPVCNNKNDSNQTN